MTTPGHRIGGNAGEITNAPELLAFHGHICNKAHDIMEAKNADYGADDDPFRNFHKHGSLGIEVRLSDKWSRLEGFMKRGLLKVKDESIEDTIIDIINYLILWLAYRRRKNAINTIATKQE